jgi:hypothetical protein
VRRRRRSGINVSTIRGKRWVRSLPGAAVEPHARSFLAGNNPKPIVLDFVQPIAARGQPIGFDWETWRDKPGRKGTLQHAD